MKRIIYVLIFACVVTGCSLQKDTASAVNFIMLSQDNEVVNTNTKLLELMNELMETYNLNEDNFAISYENLVTNETYEFNADTLMVGASTVKVPINMMYYDFAFDVNETSLLYEEQDYEEGGGSTSINYAVNDYVPLSYLMEQSIVYSDNTAINIMLDGIGVSTFKEYYANFTKAYYDASFYNENLTSAELLHAVSVQLYENSEVYEELLNDMLVAMPNQYMKMLLEDVDIAHKYGIYDEYEHDFGIVYANQPFSLSILTRDVEDAQDIIAIITYALYEYQMNQQ